MLILHLSPKPNICLYGFNVLFSIDILKTQLICNMLSIISALLSRDDCLIRHTPGWRSCWVFWWFAGASPFTLKCAAGLISPRSTQIIF
jgi:hypothetical protein